MWRTGNKRFCGVRKRASYATYFGVDDRCPPSRMEDRSCTTNFSNSRPLSLVIAPQARAVGYSPATLESMAWALLVVAEAVHDDGGSVCYERLRSTLLR